MYTWSIILIQRELEEVLERLKQSLPRLKRLLLSTFFCCFCFYCFPNSNERALLKKADSLYRVAVGAAVLGQTSKSIPYLEKLKEYDSLGVDFQILSTKLEAFIYYGNKKFETSLPVFRRVLSLSRIVSDGELESNTLSNISTIHHMLSAFDSALIYQKRSYSKAIELGDTALAVDKLNEIYPMFIELGMLDSGEYYMNLAFPDSSYFDSKYYLNIGGIQEKRKRYYEALRFYELALEKAHIEDDSNEIANALNNLAYCNFYAANYEEAFQYLDSNISVENQIQKNEYAESVRELELKYEDLERDAALKDLTFQTERDQNFKILVGSVAIMLAISLISLLLFFNNRLKSQQMLREEETKRFQKEKELASVNASLKAIDQERQRVAMDLHDGIGVLASTAKLWVSQVNKRVEGENLKEILNETNDVLNEITSDVKRIAHNMMPSSLNKLGLKMALEEMVEQLGTATSIAIEADIEDIEFVKDSGSDIMMYRLAQELLNNGVKHSEANHIRLCLSSDKNGVTLAYEDDGKGLGDAGQGNGLNTMRSRAEFMQGTMSIDDKRTKGTHISIVVPHA